MNWLVWRQHRKQFLILAIFLVAYVALLIPTGSHYWHIYQAALANCKLNPATPSCSNLGDNLFPNHLDQFMFRFVPFAVWSLPGLLGMFWGAPLLAREYADGTSSLAWTQSVSRRKWLSVTLAWMLAATAVFVGAFSAINTWWSHTPNALYFERFSNPIYFGAQNIVPVAYALFAVALGIMLGAWFRKTLVAAGVTLGVFILLGVILLPNFVRPYYFVKPITVTASMDPAALENKIPSDAWMVSRQILDKNGQTFNSFSPANMPAACYQLLTQGGGVGIGRKAVGGADPINTCLTNAGYHQIGQYQPNSRYWQFQEIESGIMLALAIIMVGATYWLVLKRDA